MNRGDAILIQVYFELLNLLPMPWQATAFIFFTTLVIYWAIYLGKLFVAILGKVGMKLTEWIVRLLLLPEFLTTSLFRWLHLTSVPGAAVYDDVIETIGGAIYKIFATVSKAQTQTLHYPVKWVILAMIVPVIAWYLRQLPNLQGSLFAQYVDQGFGIFYSIEHSAYSR
jgi:hypothetical protein